MSRKSAGRSFFAAAHQQGNFTSDTVAIHKAFSSPYGCRLKLSWLLREQKPVVKVQAQHICALRSVTDEPKR